MFCLGVLQCLAQNFNYTDENGVTWNCYASSGYSLYDGTWVEAPNVQITGASGYGDEVVVPDEIEYQGIKYPVLQMSNVFQENKTLKKITLPSKLTRLEYGAFQNCSSLTEVENTAQIKYLGGSAFYQCQSLTAIDLSSCEKIESNVFWQCSNLRTVTLKVCKNIATWGFYNCNNLQTLDISKCESIESYAFQSCSSLKSVDLSSCTSVGEYAFAGCSSLTSVGNTSLLTTINNGVFSGCYKLESIDLANCQSVGEYAFSSCSKISSIDLSSCKYMGNGAFISCSQLNTIQGIDKLTTISDNAFSGTALESVDLTKCSSLGTAAFSGCSKLKTVTGLELFATIPNYAFAGTALESLDLPKCETIGANAFRNCPNLKSINLPLCETIGQEAFSGCSNLVTVTLPVCKTIEGGGNFNTWSSEVYGAFTNCEKLEKIELPQCTTIGMCAFYGCKNLSTITLSAIETIGERAFSTCNSLNDVSLPASIKELGYRCFDGNTMLTLYATSVPTLKEQDNSGTSYPSMDSSGTDDSSFGPYVLVVVPAESLTAYQTADVWKNMKTRIFAMGTKFDYDIESTAQSTTSGIQQQIQEKELRNVVSLKVKGSINSYDIMIMRNKMINLHYLDLQDVDVVANPYEYYTGYCTQDNVLGPHSFADLSKLITVKLPNSVTHINEAFNNCSQLRSVVLPEKLISLGTEYGGWSMSSGAFSNCTMLKEVTMPSAKLVGGNSFSYCSSLKQITLPSNVTRIGDYAFYSSGLQSITLTENVDSIGQYAFSNCSFLKSVQFPPSLRVISQEAFSNCAELEKISLPGLTYIDRQTFYNCNKLQVVKIPSTLERVGDEAFSGCNNLNEVWTYTVLPISIDQKTFTNFKETVLYVPAQSYDNYYWNTQWSQFLDIREFNEPYDFFYLDNVFVLSKRFQGTPDIDIKENGALTVVGTEKQEANLVTVKSDGTTTGGTLIGDGNLDAKNLKFDITVNANQWYFLCFPFDIKFENIKAPGKYVIRKYDGAKRASNGSGGWTDLAANETVLHQGTGYIFQSAKSGSFELTVEKDKFGNLEAKDITTELNSYPASSVQNAGWNFIGNTQTSYMDVSKLGYESPITYWDGNSYQAVRPGDDELMLHPFQAFFVQKPDGVSGIEFRAEDRQTKEDAEKTIQAARSYKMTRSVDTERMLINLTLSDGTHSDNTRIVFNDKKSQAYEIDCDAAKFEADTDVPQLYTIEAEAGKLAINERPMGSVNLGYSVKKGGTLTLSAKRMDTPVLLQDNVTGNTYDLADGDYQFESEAGTFDSRFVIVPSKIVTGIADIASQTGVSIVPAEDGIHFSGLNGKKATVYATSGALLATQSADGMLHLMKGVYIVKIDGMSTKVMVK